MNQYASSNTPVAYVEGHNKGFKVTLERDLEDENIGFVQEIYAILNDTKSEWQQSVLLEPSGDGSGHFIHGVFEGMPSDGEFSLYIASPCDPNSGEYVFFNKSYQKMMEPDQFEPFTPDPEKKL